MPVQLTAVDKFINKSQIWRIKYIGKHEQDAPVSFGTLILQGYAWFDRFGEGHLIENMDLHYVRNLINFLHARAPDIQRAYQRAFFKALHEVMALHPMMGDMAQDGMDAWLDYEQARAFDWDPIRLLDDTPLLRALHARLED